MTTQNEKALRALVKLFASRSKPLTVSTIAAKTECTKATVYNRLKALEELGIRLKSSKVRESHVGPSASAYSMVVNGAAKKFLTVAR